MKKKSIRLLSAFIALVTLFSVVPTRHLFAAANTLYFTPNTGSMNINTSFSVNVKAYAASAESSGRVSGTVIFPKSLLRVTATSPSGSTYGNPSIAVDANAGTITFSGTVTPGVSGITQVFAITFQAIGAGAAGVSFSADSTVNQTTTTRNSASFTIINPNPAPNPNPGPTQPASCPAGQVGTPPNCTTPTPTPVQTPNDTPTTPTTVEENTTVDTSGTITDVSATATYNDAAVTWKLSKEQTSTTLLYGTSRTTVSTKGEVTKQDDLYRVSLKDLKPGVRYYFTISSVDASKKTSTYDSLVVTKGYPVTLAVTQNNTPAANAQVRIGSVTRTTTKEGTASFDLAANNYSATITAQDNTTLTVTFAVAAKTVPSDGRAPDAQRYTFNLEASSSGSGGGVSSIIVFIATLVGGGAILVLGILGFIAYRRRQFEGSYGPAGTTVSTAPTVIVDDGYDWRQDYPQAAAPPPPPMPMRGPGPPGAASDGYEEPKDMFELAREKDQPVEPMPQAPPPSPEDNRPR